MIPLHHRYLLAAADAAPAAVCIISVLHQWCSTMMTHTPSAATSSGGSQPLVAASNETPSTTSESLAVGPGCAPRCSHCSAHPCAHPRARTPFVPTPGRAGITFSSMLPTPATPRSSSCCPPLQGCHRTPGSLQCARSQHGTTAITASQASPAALSGSRHSAFCVSHGCSVHVDN
jgi:hypothetical protein